MWQAYCHCHLRIGRYLIQEKHLAAMKTLLIFAICVGLLAACTVPAQPWQPKAHPPAHKKK
jgi:hypothetical protein